MQAFFIKGNSCMHRCDPKEADLLACKKEIEELLAAP